MKSLKELGIEVGSESGREPRELPIGSRAWLDDDQQEQAGKKLGENISPQPEQEQAE